MTQKRPHWFDFQKVTTNDLKAEQDAWLSAVGGANAGASGTGVQLASPLDLVILDTDRLNTTQSAWVATNSFDGRGVLLEQYACTDIVNGNQLSIALSGTNASERVPLFLTVLGTDFNDNIYYEHIRCPANGKYQTYGHFKVVKNIMFQNMFGNTDARIDGRGCLALGANGGRAIIAEAGSMLPSADTIVETQSKTPDIVFAKYKLYDSGKTLEQVLTEALNSEYTVDELNVNTTISETKLFSAGASSEVTYGQKFRMRGNNIQKIQLLLALDSGSSWSGEISVGLKKLLNKETFSSATRYLPDTLIEFDPETEYLAEVSLNQSDLEDLGVVLGPDHQVVDFVLSETSIANSNLSELENDAWYAITVRRTGSSTTGTISIPIVPVYTGIDPYTKREDEDFVSGTGRFTVFSGGIWTDIQDRTTWYRVCGDAFRAASGTVIDEGTRVTSEKTATNDKGLKTQKVERGIAFANSTVDADNYFIVQAATQLTDIITHPATGDNQASRESDIPDLASLTLSEVEDLLVTKPTLVCLAVGTDTNPRANPVITGTVYHPGLFRNSILDIPNPPTDLINKNVVGSIITPNTLKPSLRYRITAQQLYVDGYGDMDGNGEINISDLLLLEAFDGYSTALATTSSFTSSQQIATVIAEETPMVSILKANLDTDSEVGTADIAALNDYLTNGTGFPNGQGQFNRIRLYVEPLTDAMDFVDDYGLSTLQIHVADTDLLATFSSPVNWSIEPVRVWLESAVQVVDIRRIAISASTSFSGSDLRSTPPSGGQNNLVLPGDLYLGGNIKDLDGAYHRLDYERTIVELELPDGTSEKEINIFNLFVKNKMRFSDGALVTTEALAAGQIFFEVQVSSFAKNLGFAVDGYVDYSDVGDSADEAIGTYIDQDTGLMRIRAYNIVNNDIRPEVRTRIYVIVNIKKAGWRNPPRKVSSAELVALWS
jgi:hypothetical protein